MAGGRVGLLRELYNSTVEDILQECTFEVFESHFGFSCTTTDDKTFLMQCYEEFLQHIRSFCMYELDVALRESAMQDSLTKLDRYEAEQPLAAGGTRR
mmetsp:Transcript_29723/g.76780  ORF Transcript_29723/g.76780 Transcript_29723/m.76780 type:complete len:98 (-) Transcript_29723:397-690(-)